MQPFRVIGHEEFGQVNTVLSSYQAFAAGRVTILFMRNVEFLLLYEG